MRHTLIAVVAFAVLTSFLCACKSNSCFDEEPSAGSAHILGGITPLGGADAGARDSSDDAWRVGCAVLNCGPGGVCGPDTDATGVTKAVCWEAC